MKRLLRSNLPFICTYLLLWTIFALVGWNLSGRWIDEYGETAGIAMSLLHFVTLILLTVYTLAWIEAVDQKKRRDDEDDDGGGNSKPRPQDPIDGLLAELDRESRTKVEMT